MLRTLVLAGAAALVAVGAWLCLAGVWVPGVQLLGVGLVLLVGVLIESWRYRKEPRPGAKWEPTGERFVDPATGKQVEVLYDARTGERRYVTEEDGGAQGR
jgi:hypothetical protein